MKIFPNNPFILKKSLQTNWCCAIIINGYAAVAELADALDSKSSGAIRAGSSPASGIRIKDLTERSVRSLLYDTKKSRKEQKMEKDKSFLGTKPVGKLLLQLALPTVAAQLINMLYNIVDRIYIGHIPGEGALALTGVGVCMPLIMVVSAFAALVGNGGAPRASIFMGKNDTSKAEQTLGNCFTMQIIISLILTVILFLGNRSFLLAFGASANTIDYAVGYMNIYAVGTIFVQLTLGMNNFITAQGFAKTGMLSVLIGAVSNIILDPVFIFGFHMGVRLPLWKKDLPEASEKHHETESRYHSALYGSWLFSLCHAAQ